MDAKEDRKQSVHQESQNKINAVVLLVLAFSVRSQFDLEWYKSNGSSANSKPTRKGNAPKFDHTNDKQQKGKPSMAILLLAGIHAVLIIRYRAPCHETNGTREQVC
jgi:hypothetical protein